MSILRQAERQLLPLFVGVVVVCAACSSVHGDTAAGAGVIGDIELDGPGLGAGTGAVFLGVPYVDAYVVRPYFQVDTTRLTITAKGAGKITIEEEIRNFTQHAWRDFSWELAPNHVGDNLNEFAFTDEIEYGHQFLTLSHQEKIIKLSDGLLGPSELLTVRYEVNVPHAGTFVILAYDAIVETPEPSIAVGLIGMACAGLSLRQMGRRRRRAQ